VTDTKEENMKGKVLCVGIIFLFLVVGVSNVFAQSSIGSTRNYNVKTDGRGNFWIDDSSKGICYVISVQSTGRSKTYTFLCEGKSRKTIQNVVSLTGAIAEWFGIPQAGAAADIANLIWDAACWYFDD
jgi:hypothetical protein